MSGERFTDEDLTRAELAVAYVLRGKVRDSVEAVIAEVRAHRAAALAPAERVAVTYLRACIVERDGEYALDLRGTELTTALNALTKLTQEHR